MVAIIICTCLSSVDFVQDMWEELVVTTAHEISCEDPFMWEQEAARAQYTCVMAMPTGTPQGEVSQTSIVARRAGGIR